MNKKTLKITKLVIIIMIVITIVCSFVVSQDDYHVETCNEDHCVYCAIIQLAQNIFNLFISFIVAIIIGVFIYFFLSRLIRRQDVFIQSSLVFQKVQLNE